MLLGLTSPRSGVMFASLDGFFFWRVMGMVDLAVDGRAELLSELDKFSSKWSRLNLLFSRRVHVGKRVSGGWAGGTVE